MKYVASLSGQFAVFACCVVLTSCSDVEPLELTNATLDGTISYKGKPVPNALIIVANDTQSATGRAAGDGTYHVKYVPLGEVQIAVNTDAAKGALMGQMMAAKQSKSDKPNIEFVAVPKKYFDPATSGITTSIKDEPNQFDINLE